MNSTRKSLLLLAIGLPLLVIAYFVPSAYRKAQMDAEVDRLCAVDGGTKLYERVSLPAELFDQWGNPNIPFKGTRNALNSEYVVENFSTREEKGTSLGQRPLTIHRFHYKIVRRSDDRVLGEAISYSRSGGDPEGPWHPSNYQGVCTEQANRLERLVFQRKG